jgi:hypothetical protein
VSEAWITRWPTDWSTFTNPLIWKCPLISGYAAPAGTQHITLNNPHELGNQSFPVIKVYSIVPYVFKKKKKVSRVVMNMIFKLVQVFRVPIFYIVFINFATHNEYAIISEIIQ